MIFVTVGTHEQPFDRLLKEVALLVKEGVIKEEVYIQSGYSKYVAENCKSQSFYAYSDMKLAMAKARIIITHGGPSSFLEAVKLNKIPIVVPRQKKFDEHVNDHQLLFSREVEKRLGNIIVVENVKTLGSIIQDYDEISKNHHNLGHSNNKAFNRNFNNVVRDLMNE